MLEMIMLHFSIQGEDIIEHTKRRMSFFYILVWKRKILFNILMLSVISVHFHLLVDHYVT